MLCRLLICYDHFPAGKLPFSYSDPTPPTVITTSPLSMPSPPNGSVETRALPLNFRADAFRPSTNSFEENRNPPGSVKEALSMKKEGLGNLKANLTFVTSG